MIGLGGLGAVLGLLAISGPLVLVSLLVVAGGVLWDGSRRGEDAEKPS